MKYMFVDSVIKVVQLIDWCICQGDRLHPDTVSVVEQLLTATGSSPGVETFSHLLDWFIQCSPRRRHQLPADQLTVGSISVAPVDSVHDLGILLNSDMSMDAHLIRLISLCFGVLRQIRCIRRSLPREALLTLVMSFITSKIDNCNVALAGLPQHDLDRIQSMLNAAA